MLYTSLLVLADQHPRSSSYKASEHWPDISKIKHMVSLMDMEVFRQMIAG